MELQALRALASAKGISLTDAAITDVIKTLFVNVDNSRYACLVDEIERELAAGCGREDVPASEQEARFFFLALGTLLSSDGYRDEDKACRVVCQLCAPHAWAVDGPATLLQGAACDVVATLAGQHLALAQMLGSSLSTMLGTHGEPWSLLAPPPFTATDSFPVTADGAFEVLFRFARRASPDMVDALAGPVLTAACRVAREGNAEARAVALTRIAPPTLRGLQGPSLAIWSAELWVCGCELWASGEPARQALAMSAVCAMWGPLAGKFGPLHGGDAMASTALWEMLHGALEHSDEGVCKRAVSMLRSLLGSLADGTVTSVPHTGDEALWGGGGDHSWGELWDGFFAVYETMEQLPLHLTQGVWPLLVRVLGTTEGSLFPYTWARILLHKALTHRNPHVRIYSLTQVVGHEEGKSLLRVDDNLVYQHLIPAMNAAHILQLPLIGKALSPERAWCADFLARHIAHRAIEPQGLLDTVEAYVRGLTQEDGTRVLNDILLFHLEVLASLPSSAAMSDRTVRRLTLIAEAQISSTFLSLRPRAYAAALRAVCTLAAPAEVSLDTFGTFLAAVPVMVLREGLEQARATLALMAAHHLETDPTEDATGAQERIESWLQKAVRHAACHGRPCVAARLSALCSGPGPFLSAVLPCLEPLRRAESRAYASQESTAAALCLLRALYCESPHVQLSIDALKVDVDSFVAGLSALTERALASSCAPGADNSTHAAWHEASGALMALIAAYQGSSSVQDTAGSLLRLAAQRCAQIPDLPLTGRAAAASAVAIGCTERALSEPALREAAEAAVLQIAESSVDTHRTRGPGSSLRMDDLTADEVRGTWEAARCLALCDVPPSGPSVRRLWDAALDAAEAADADDLVFILEACAVLRPLLPDLQEEEVQRLCTAATPDATARGGHKENTRRLARAVAASCFPREWLCAPALHPPLEGLFSSCMTLPAGLAGHFVTVLVAHCCEVWTAHPDVAARYTKYLAALCLRGPLASCDILNGCHSVGPAQGADQRADAWFRALVNRFLDSLDTSHEATRVIVQGVAIALLHKDEEHAHHERAMSAGHPIHLVKVRLWQTLCVLSRHQVPMGGTEAVLNDTIMQRAWASLHFDHLPSGRVYVEAFLSRALILDPAQVSARLIPLLTNPLERTQVSVSLLVIAGQVLQNTTSVETFSCVLRCVLPYVGAQNHSVRALAQLAVYMALSIVFTGKDNIIQQVHLEESSIHPARSMEPAETELLRPLYTYLHTNKDCSKVRKALRVPPSAYDPALLCCMRHIFVEYPGAHTECMGEVLPEALFDLVNKEIKGRRSELGGLRESSAATGAEDSSGSAQKAREGGGGTAFNFQKKIVPWEEWSAGDGPCVDAREAHLTRPHQEIIVVASLIDKAPNLAGLARTCEIFNATSLVVGNMKVMEDTLFKQVSVTAEKWVPIEEVKRADLGDFIQEKRAEGWHCVGLEQTANSHSILGYEFPPRCVLVLGEEQRGIPADIIHLLDDCVEIPQLGIIRSLNVHVSASICIWEFTKQNQFGFKNGALKQT